MTWPWGCRDESRPGASLTEGWSRQGPVVDGAGDVGAASRGLAQGSPRPAPAGEGFGRLDVARPVAPLLTKCRRSGHLMTIVRHEPMVQR
jgi:hypothetical protein